PGSRGEVRLAAGLRRRDGHPARSRAAARPARIGRAAPRGRRRGPTGAVRLGRFRADDRGPPLGADRGGARSGDPDSRRGASAARGGARAAGDRRRRLDAEAAGARSRPCPRPQGPRLTLRRRGAERPRNQAAEAGPMPDSSEYEPAFGATPVDDAAADDLARVRQAFELASQPYLSTPVSWFAWAVLLPLAALTSARAAAIAGPRGLVLLW